MHVGGLDLTYLNLSLRVVMCDELAMQIPGGWGHDFLITFDCVAVCPREECRSTDSLKITSTLVDIQNYICTPPLHKPDVAKCGPSLNSVAC